MRKQVERVFLLVVSTLVCLTPILASSQPTEPPSIQINIAQPVDGGLAGNDLVVGVWVTSTFEVNTVKANVEGREITLAFSGFANICDRFGTCRPGWRGQISLAGLARGQKTLTVTVTDIQGGSQQAQSTFIYDQPPSLSIAAPLEQTVARPTLHVSAICTDDDPAGCSSLTVAVDGNTVATATATINANVSLAAYDGRRVTVRFLARDSRGQFAQKERTVFVESSNKLNEVSVASGRILDVHVDRILHLETTENINTLKILNRSTGQEMVILSDPSKVTQYGFLTPRGAIFVTKSGDTFNLTESRDGTLIQIGSLIPPNPNLLPFALKVKGDYAIWNVFRGDWEGDVINLRNLVTGTNTEIANFAAIVGHDVTATGEVAFWSKPLPVYYNSNIYSYRGGPPNQLTNDSTVQNHGPLTDGINIAYMKGGAILLHTSAGPLVLAPTGRYPAAQTGHDYQVNGGWTAFTRMGSGDATQVWVRAPDGQETQKGFFGSRSFLSAVNSQGEVAFRNAGRLHLARTDQALLNVASDLGNAFFQNGLWYVTIGRSLFQVSDPAPSLPALLTQNDTSWLVVLESVTMTAGSFHVSTQGNFSSDQRTRVMVFAANITSLPDGHFPTITIQIEDAQRRSFTVPVEHVGRVPNFDWLTQINFKLPEELLNSGDVWVTLHVGGSRTNPGLMSIRPSGP